MTIKKHNDYAKEIERLKQTKSYLEETIKILEKSREKYSEEIKEAYIQLDYLDSSLSYSSIIINTQLLGELEKNFDMLLYSREKPYFARIDIKQEDKENYEELYIGKVSLYDTKMETPLVVDWRAPVASIYYDGRLGSTNYLAGKVQHNVDLSLKRQYIVENGALVSFMDVDISTTDAFLQASLESHAGSKLKDIVSTIQSEQNKIIRADIDKPLIVQGVAGSGKTTIALHRIAYLLYTYSETYDPDQFMILAPNTLFLDYISMVLPELGANRIRQTTYVDFMSGIIGKKVKLSDSNKKLNELVRLDKDALSDEEKKSLIKTAQFKNNLLLKDLLDDYVSDLEKEIIPDMDLQIFNMTILTKADISKLFYESFEYLPIYKRIDSIKQYLSKYLRNKMKDIVGEIEKFYNTKIYQLKNTEEETEERREKTRELMEERENTKKDISKKSKSMVNDYIKKYVKKDLFTLYDDFLKKHEEFKQKTYELEDLAPLVYLNKKIFGISNELDIKMVFVDEAQDFSNFQFYVLKEVLGTEKFNIFGDLSQGIHNYRSIDNWETLRKDVFKEESNYLVLQQSYRTTVEIMDEANIILSYLDSDNVIKGKPVVRHGEIPEIKFYDNKENIISQVVKKLKDWKHDGLTTIAVIVKSAQEATKVFNEIKKINTDITITLVDENTEHFDNHFLVIPSYLSKGLEFDGVIVTTFDEKFIKDPLDVKLLYVSMTRAMHKMALYGYKDSVEYYEEI